MMAGIKRAGLRAVLGALALSNAALVSLAFQSLGAMTAVTAMLAALALALPAFISLMALFEWVDAVEKGRVPPLPDDASQRRGLARHFAVLGALGAIETGVVVTTLLCGAGSPFGSPFRGLAGPLAQGIVPATSWLPVFIAGVMVWSLATIAAWRWHEENGGTASSG